MKNGDNILKKHLETSCSKTKYTSPLIKSEIINVFGDLIQLKILERVSKTNFFTIFVAETTYLSQIEQLLLCIHYVDKEMFTM